MITDSTGRCGQMPRVDRNAVDTGPAAEKPEREIRRYVDTLKREPWITSVIHSAQSGCGAAHSQMCRRRRSFGPTTGGGSSPAHRGGS
jgi:hypothetical protein